MSLNVVVYRKHKTAHCKQQKKQQLVIHILLWWCREVSREFLLLSHLQLNTGILAEVQKEMLNRIVWKTAFWLPTPSHSTNDIFRKEETRQSCKHWSAWDAYKWQHDEIQGNIYAHTPPHTHQKQCWHTVGKLQKSQSMQLKQILAQWFENNARICSLRIDLRSTGMRKWRSAW